MEVQWDPLLLVVFAFSLGRSDSLAKLRDCRDVGRHVVPLSSSWRSELDKIDNLQQSLLLSWSGTFCLGE